mmetsp:Transcript_10700/g.25747  ORF Transcript_10700/g.25747 Transcript_10700/m.25747 type:complete len:439 (+) Transcript_10700:133-1449(+)
MRNSLLWTALLSGLAIRSCDAADRTTTNASPRQRADDERPMRSFMTVEFDYRLEANRTKSIGNNATEDSKPGDNNIFIEKERNAAPLEHAQLDIDTNIISYLQEAIPGGDITENGTLPDVEYTTINSRFINMCFTESDACKFVKSRIKLSYVENLPKASMERITLDLVRNYLNEINEKNPSVNTMFVYPMIFSSTVQLDLSPVAGPMSDEDTEHLVTTFYNVFHAIVGALDGDTEVSEVYFVYQDVVELDHDDDNITVSENEIPYRNKLSVNLKYFGKCRYCTEDDLDAIVYETFEPNENAFLATLTKANEQTDVSYFLSIKEVSFSRYAPPDVLPDPNASIRGGELASKKIPWLLYGGVVIAVIVLFTGVHVIVKDQKELKKDEPSTSNESSDESEKVEDGNGGGKAQTSNDSSTSSLNTNTLNQTDMHSDYEVYVY